MRPMITMTVARRGRNLVRATMAATTAVAVAPTKLMMRPDFQPGSRRVCQRTNMANWEMVKDVKTPTHQVESGARPRP